MADYPYFNNPYTPDNSVADRRQQDAQKFDQMVQMLSLANRADGQTMLGFALGKLLHDTWMHYKEKQDADAYEKGANAELKPPLTGEALQHEENFRQYMGIPTMQEAYRQTLYHGGQSPAEYYGKQLLTGSPQTTAAAAQTTTSTTVDGNTATTTTEAVKPAGTNNVYAAQTNDWSKTPTNGGNSFSQLVDDLRKRQDMLTRQTSPYGMGNLYGKTFF